MYEHLIYAALFSIPMICISYAEWAKQKGLPVGATLAKDASWPKVISLVFVLYLLIGSFLHLSWWSPIVVFLLGSVIAVTLMSIMGKWVQAVGTLGIVPAAIASIFLTDSIASFFT